MQYLGILALPLLAAAAPALNIRAGAPGKTSIPSGCSLTHAYPSPNATSFAATESFQSANSLYSYSLSPGNTTPDGTDDSSALQDCLETCYSFGNPGECKSVWTAHGVEYEAYGTTTKAEFVCMLYGANITSQDLGPSSAGSDDSQAHAVMVGCARSQ